MQTAKEIFDALRKLDVSEKAEEKNGYTYLSWAWAWQEFKKQVPEAVYEVFMFEDSDGLSKPYLKDPDLGYLVMTSVTAGDVTHVMWLPVMDNRNSSIPVHQTTVTEMKWSNEAKAKVPTERIVDKADMCDVNKALMRCLVKNLAMFGLGLYIYAGEDVPEEA